MKKSCLISSIAFGIIAATALVSGNAVAFNIPYNYKCQTSCPATCNPCCCQNLLSGLYVGGQAAYDSYRIRQISTSIGDSTDDLTSISDVRSAVGIAGGLFAGYGFYFNGPLYLGTEVWANANNAGVSTRNISFAASTGDNESSDINGRWSWGVSVLPGLKINSGSLLYGRVGYARHRIKTSGSFFDSVFGTTYFNKSFWYSGFQFGVGAELIVAGPWSVRTEFDHTFLGNNTTTITGINTTTWSASDNQFSFGVIYHIV